MINIESSSEKTINGYDLAELLNKLKTNQEMTEEEMEDVLYNVLFKATDKSLEAEEVAKSATGPKVAFYTIAGKICGRQTKFLPYSLQYRREAADIMRDNYDQVFEGFRITSMDICAQNLKTIVKQLEAANRYSQTYGLLSDEIEENISDGLASFAGFVGMDNMEKLEEQRAKVIKLSKEYKKVK